MGKIKNPFKNIVDTVTTVKNNTLNNAKKDVKSAVNNFTTKKNNTIQGTKKKIITIQDKISNIKINSKLGFVALLPFKKTMYNALKRKGVKNVSMSDNIAKISLMFYNIVMLGRTSLEFSYYEKFNVDENDTGFISQSAGAAISEYSEGSVSQDQASQIVDAIIKLLKSLAGKKANGEAMSVDQGNIGNDTIADINNTELDEGGNVKINWYDASWVKWAGGILLFVVTILLIMHFKK